MERLQRVFKRFAEQEAKGKSPLYKKWCEKIVDDAEIRSLLQHIPVAQPAPNLFFAAVQYVSKQHQHPLMRIFEEPATYKDADFALLVDVCRTT